MLRLETSVFFHSLDLDRIRTFFVAHSNNDLPVLVLISDVHLLVGADPSRFGLQPLFLLDLASLGRLASGDFRDLSLLLLFAPLLLHQSF